MLADATTNSVWTYVLIGVVVLLLIAMPIMMNIRNKCCHMKQNADKQTLLHAKNF